MLLVEFEGGIDPVVNERVIALADRLRAQALRGVHDVAPGYCTLGVHFDPLRTDLGALEQAIEVESRNPSAIDRPSDRPLVDIPVCYGGAAGPDLESVAEMSGCTPLEVVGRHASRIYRVYMLGFVPGFAYLGRVDPSIAVARHRVPRVRVPAGSVGIAGEQTGVYPIETPGGWQLIGQTRVPMFDPRHRPPSLLKPGDRVRFVPESGGG